MSSFKRVKSASNLGCALWVGGTVVVALVGGAQLHSQENCLPAPSGLVAWWRAEGNAQDSADENHGTIVGTITFGNGQVGQAFRFDGSGYISVPASASLDVGMSSGLTIEGWVFPTRGGVGWAMPIVEWDSTSRDGVHLWIEAGLKLYANVKDIFGGAHMITSAEGVISTNGFQHVALTYDKANGTAALFVNGQPVATDTLGSFTPLTSYPLNLGKRTALVTGYGTSFQGVMDEISIYHRALTPSEIQAIYAAGAAGKCPVTLPPSTNCVAAPSGLVAWWRAEGNALDSADDHHGTLYGVDFAPGMVGQAFRIVPSRHRVRVPDSPDFMLTNSLTVEGWIYIAGDNGIIFFRGDSRPGLDPYALSMDDPGYIAFQVQSHTATARIRAQVPYNQWVYVAAVLDGDTSEMRLYLNGQLAAQTYTVVRPFAELDPSREPGIGIGNTAELSNDFNFNGLIDEISLYNRALTPSEIQAIYAAGAAGKCPVTLPPSTNCVAAPSGLVAWWRAEGNAHDSADSHHGTAIGGVGFTSGMVGRAFAFDGRTGYVMIPAHSNLNVGLGGGLTVEAWVNPSSLDLRPLVEWNNNSGIAGVGAQLLWLSVDRRVPGDGYGNIYANLRDTELGDHYISSPARVMSANRFQHLALTYDKSTGIATIYHNGVAVATENLGVFTPQTSYDLYLGLRPSGPFSGLYFGGVLDEVSLYDRALSAAEIQAIYMAGSAGKCAEPPVIVEHPASMRVNVGGTATFNVVGSGSPILSYQWQFNGLDIPGATEPSLTIPNVQEPNAGYYCVRVTNWFGAALSSNAVLTVNHPPVADASASRLLYITCTGTNAAVILDGSRSMDPDGDALEYAWFEQVSGSLLATGEVAALTLPLGGNVIALVVSDGLASDTNTVTIEVITPAEAVERLMGVVRAGVERSTPLIATLRAALASIERSNPVAAINQLRAFQNQVRAQIAPYDPSLAQQFIEDAQQVIDALLCASGEVTHPRVEKIIRRYDGKVEIDVTAPAGWNCVIQVSTNLVDWVELGPATELGDCKFILEDREAADAPARFYRVVVRYAQK